KWGGADKNPRGLRSFVRASSERVMQKPRNMNYSAKVQAKSGRIRVDRTAASALRLAQKNGAPACAGAPVLGWSRRYGAIDRSPAWNMAAPVRLAPDRLRSCSDSVPRSTLKP